MIPMRLSKRKVPALNLRLEEFGVNVEALKRVGLSADALDVLYCAVRIVDSHRRSERQVPKFDGLCRNPLP